MQVGARELRARAAEVLQAVREGETVTLTYRGRVIGEIRPVGAHSGSEDAMAGAFGMWRDRKDMKDVRTWIRASRGERAARLPSIRTS